VEKEGGREGDRKGGGREKEECENWKDARKKREMERKINQK